MNLDVADPLRAFALHDTSRTSAHTRVDDLLGAAGRPSRADSAHLLSLIRRYASEPTTPMETAREELQVPREKFAQLVDLFTTIPELRAAVLAGPASKYWTNTVLPMEDAHVIDDVLHHRVVYPRVVSLYPGPTCMFRCHFCVRVTGARYAADTQPAGAEIFTSLIEEMPQANPFAMYASGGLEPLTNSGIGDIVAHAARRDFKFTVYTNAFALTEQTLDRQPGLWNLHAVRTSLYGLDDAEYLETTGKKAAFSRVKSNLLNFQRRRSERDHRVRLGFSYLVLPGRTRRLLDLVDLIAELDDAGTPVDFLDLREDYSGRSDGSLTRSERADLQEVLEEFEERVATRTPHLRVDLGYALHSLRAGVQAQLIRIEPDQMRPSAHIQAGVQVDLLGDVYLYREAGFPGLQGAERYIAGRIRPGHGLMDVIAEYVAEGRTIEPRPGDQFFLDGFDQVLTARLNQAEADLAAGWGDRRGFLR
ncbi:dTDP-4-amino-4,6-dideoxy-D-glucose ammonia-lyase [Aeromicrobium sp. CF3.5]|uniref:dTDP-4-amino-4,6-dideoxy-D-glucose ammonia-lyase n=1 Tax=Aeromicrobium sp. CF3.5 TaxID=3373078 RepID=UPI003EE589BD